MSDPKQYNAIGAQYNKIKSLPNGDLEQHTVACTLGDVTGQRVLDLACGAGHYSSFLRQRGAAHVVGVDISSEMIDAARTLHASDAHLEFHVGDCTKPELYSSRDGKGGNFDLVFAGYLLNYVATPEEMLKMWQTVCMNLRRGCRFLTLVPDPGIDMEKPWGDNNSGLSLTPLGRVPFGWHGRCNVHVDPPFGFETYVLGAEVYERCAKEAGMRDLRWIDAVLPEDERRNNGFWDELLRQKPIFKVIESWS